MANAGEPGDGTAHAPPSPVLPDFCGLDELAKVVLALRRWEREPANEGAISDGGVRLLLEFAFQTSLTVEEGRHPRFRFFVAAPSTGWTAPPMARFDPPIPLRPDPLRRMVPAPGSWMTAADRW